MPLRLLTVEMRATAARQSPTKTRYTVLASGLTFESRHSAGNWMQKTAIPEVMPIS